MSIVEEIRALCDEVVVEVKELLSLTGLATHPWWVEVDPGYDKLKQMARIQADVVVAKAQELRAIIPD